ncbi:uncharacterized protein LOC125145959 [Tachysurus fulvidraco]|uniref:uncharacterized protein LOC125145959 n=1 Tax=Tachysurus fulvidraco TaxID=1234273 RepID=UPI001FEFDFC5|nr:uncharacterized protein LOC125145959 [Tachysurus fulvidraco]
MISVTIIQRLKKTTAESISVCLLCVTPGVEFKIKHFASISCSEKQQQQQQFLQLTKNLYSKMSKDHDKEKDSCSNSSQDQNNPKLETLPDMGEYAVPRKSKTKLGLDRNFLANRDQHLMEHDLQSVSYSVISFEHMSPENIDLEASESKNTNPFDLTVGDASEVNEEVSENLTSRHASLSNESEGDQQNREDVLTELQTSTQEIRSDISDSIVFPNSETVSNPKTSTPTSRDILHPFSSFIKCHNEFQSRRRSTSDIDSITFPQASARSCPTQETTPMDTVQIHKLYPRSKSESDISQQPAFPCVTEVSRPIMIWQREEREEMKRKAQREREQAARVTKLGLDRNVLANRDKYSMEHDLQFVSYSVIPFEHTSPENIDLEASESKNTDSFDLTESDASEIKEEVNENPL